MSYTLSNLIQDGVGELGRVASRNIIATGGSTLTVIDTKLNLVGAPVYTDGDDSVVLGTMLIVATTDGLAPQGEFSRISAYAESSTTFTVDTAFTAVVGAGDECLIIHSQFRLDELISMANRALRDIGEMYKIDSSITTSGTKQYDLPVAAKGYRPARIDIYVDADTRAPISAFDYIPSAAGSVGSIIFQYDPPTAKTLYITYSQPHPRVSDFDDAIDEDIAVPLAKWSLVVQLYRWQNPDDRGQINAMNEALRNYEMAKQRYKMWKPSRIPKYFVSK